MADLYHPDLDTFIECSENAAAVHLRKGWIPAERAAAVHFRRPASREVDPEVILAESPAEPEPVRLGSWGDRGGREEDEDGIEGTGTTAPKTEDRNDEEEDVDE